MDILQSFVFDNSTHKVHVLRDENDDPLFRASDIGKVLSICNIRSSISDFDDDEKAVHTVDTPGGKQEVIFLTEQGVLRLVMISRKPIAKPFQKWVFNVIKTIRKTGKYELQNEIEQMKEHHDNLFREYKDSEDERIHKTLVEGYENRTTVYFGKIKTMEDGRILVKIGCTKNIRPRATALKKEFGNISIFRLFECERQEEFENFLHHHKDIRRYVHREMINGIKRSHEVFCMTEEQKTRAVNIATRAVSYYRYFDLRGQDDAVNQNPLVRKLCEINGIQINSDPDSNGVEYANKRGRCTLTGPKIQSYSEDGSALVQTYETLIDAVRDLISDGASQVGISGACKNKIVKYGYRWATLDRSEPDDKVQQIGATVQITQMRKGLVAGLNEDRTKVMKVYTSFAACGKENGFKAQGAVQKRMDRGATVGGHHIVSWSDLSDEIQDEWMSENTLPVLPPNATCIRINRLDPVTRKVLRTYGTMNEVKLHFKIGQHALKNAIEGDLVKHNFKWSYAE